MGSDRDSDGPDAIGMDIVQLLADLVTNRDYYGGLNRIDFGGEPGAGETAKTQVMEALKPLFLGKSRDEREQALRLMTTPVSVSAYFLSTQEEAVARLGAELSQTQERVAVLEEEVRLYAGVDGNRDEHRIDMDSPAARADTMDEIDVSLLHKVLEEEAPAPGDAEESFAGLIEDEPPDDVMTIEQLLSYQAQLEEREKVVAAFEQEMKLKKWEKREADAKQYGEERRRK